VLRLMRTGVVGVAILIAGTSNASGQDGQRRPQRPARGGPQDQRREGALKVGAIAPDFTLSTLDGKRKVKLSSFRGHRPVALIFGSYT
jgi:hypothetical protein